MKSWTDPSIRKSLPRHFFVVSGSIPVGILLMWAGFGGMKYELPFSIAIVIIGAISILARIVDSFVPNNEHSLLTKNAALNDIARSHAALVQLQAKSAEVSVQVAAAIKRAREIAEDQIDGESDIDKLIRESQRRKPKPENEEE